MTGQLNEGVTATDLVLRVTEMLRKAKVVGKFVEFHGEGAADRSLTAEGSPHDPASSLCFRSVRHSTLSHQALLSSPEILAALDEVLGAGAPAATSTATVAAASCAEPERAQPSTLQSAQGHQNHP